MFFILPLGYFDLIPSSYITTTCFDLPTFLFKVIKSYYVEVFVCIFGYSKYKICIVTNLEGLNAFLCVSLFSASVRGCACECTQV